MYQFSEPHPGLLGCPKRLHDDIVQVLAEMDGCQMSLSEALCKIHDVVKGIDEEGVYKLQSHSNGKKSGFVLLTQGSVKAPPMHSWRLIRYNERT